MKNKSKRAKKKQRARGKDMGDMGSYDEMR